jgi:hypothetical protein
METVAEGQKPAQNSSTVKAVEASLNYIAESTEKPVYYAYEPPAGTPRQTGRFLARTVPIRNGRALVGRLSLDKQGFELRPHETAVPDFYNREEVERVYYPEIESLLKQATGASKVVIFDHQVRCLPLAQRGEKNAREYAKTVHNDYTAKSGPRRVRDHLPSAEADQLLRHRFAEINVWRPIRGPVESSPLAVCDARSIEPRDFVASDLVYPDKVGETYRFTYNPNHRWFYFPHLERNEAILLKCYDSKEDGRARFTAHTAFEDPTSPLDAAPRESIEVRALVFWPPDREPDSGEQGSRVES